VRRFNVSDQRFFSQGKFVGIGFVRLRKTLPGGLLVTAPLPAAPKSARQPTAVGDGVLDVPWFKGNASYESRAADGAPLPIDRMGFGRIGFCPAILLHPSRCAYRSVMSI